MHAHARLNVVTSAFSKRSVFAVHTNALSKLSTMESVSKKFSFRCMKTPFQCERKAKLDKKVAFNFPIKFIQINVNGALSNKPHLHQPYFYRFNFMV